LLYPLNKALLAHAIERVTSLLQCTLLTLTLCSSTAKLVLLQLSHELVSI